MAGRSEPVALVLLCLIAAPADAEQEASTLFRSGGGPPPGFEAFFEKQETFVDVYYAGRPLTSTLAQFDVATITFDEPARIVELIPNLLDPERVLAALSGELPANAAALCGRAARDDCGRLTPEVAGVIFESGRFRATVFIAATELEVQGPSIERYLPPSDAEFSALQNLTANYSGADSGSTDAWTVQSAMSLSRGETHLQLDTAWSNDDDLTIDAANVRREFEGRVVQAGLYRTRGQSLGFVQDRDILGMRIGSSLQTRADRAFSGGTPLDVFLSTRARVEIFQDGRLLDSSVYDAGNQILDTSNLPEGAYEVELRIRESGGSERTERRLFVKTTRIPPADQPLWQIELGREFDRNTGSTLPDDTGEWFARASHTRRVTDGFGIDIGTSAASGDAIVQAGAYLLGESTELQISTFLGSHRDTGLAALARLDLGRMNGSADFRLVRGPKDGDERLVGPERAQGGLNLSGPLLGGVASVNTRYERRGDDNARASQGVSWRRYFSRGVSGGWRLAMELSRQEEDWFALASVQFEFRNGQMSGYVQPGVRVDRSEDGLDDEGMQSEARLAWERSLSSGDRVRLGIAGNSGFREDRARADARYEGRAGVLQLEMDRDYGASDRTAWTASFNTSLLTDGEALSIGGRDSARSAALVAIDGAVPGARFEVLVDGIPRGVAPAGSVTPIHLRPWQTYTIRLRPVGDALLAWENREERFTLYPGNVVRLQWQVSELLVLVGRAVDGAGEPVESARIDGAYGLAMTEFRGLFQAEIARPPVGMPIDLVLQRRDREPCTLRIDTEDRTAHRGVMRVGVQRCE